ncbi:MAG: (2Fe-2S)-binding protein [Acidimicrobiales bacterium]
MYVCHCLAVTDHEIKAAMDAGARDVLEVSRRCQAATGCGGCYPALVQLLQEHLGQNRSAQDYGLATTESRRRNSHAA